MYKSTLLFIIGLFALLVSQGYWLRNTYREYQDKNKTLINNLFYDAIEYEAVLRWIGQPQKKNGKRFTIKRADEMTPEERKKLKGDTLIIKAKDKKQAGSIAQLFSQILQEDLLRKRPIRLPILDSLFSDRLQSHGLPLSFQISLYDQQRKEIKQIRHAFQTPGHSIETPLKPIGNENQLFIQAKVDLPPSVIIQHMLYSLIISVLVVVIVIVCLYYQWKALGKARLQLQEREQTVHAAIHDLKAPLNTVFALLDYLQQTDLEPDMCTYLKNGKIQIRKLTDTIESMLHQYKSQHQKAELCAVALNLPETVQQVFNGLQTLYPDKQAVFRIDNQLKSPCISTDSVRLERCIRNLLENALKYSDEKVEITVELSEKNRQVSMAITDTGWGIPEKQQKQLGKQFYRVKRTDKPGRDGFGIGLACTKLLAAELGGSLRFQSMEGKGSTFTLRLPIL